MEINRWYQQHSNNRTHKINTMKNISTRQIIDVVLIILLLVFIAQNLDSAKVNFLFFGFELPLVILIAIVFFVGFYTAKVFNKPKKDIE